MSKVFITAGATGSGKTTFTKQILKEIDLPKFIYDVNNEYSEFSRQPFTDFKQFCEQAAKKTKHVIVFEEATIFFTHSGATEIIKEILVRKRHTGNVIIFNFHALRQIPLYILDFADFLTIKKTVLDNVKRFEQRQEIVMAYEHVKQSKNTFETHILNLRPKLQ